MLLFKCFVPGRPPSKKNTKKVVRRFGTVNVIYSKQFREWEKTALLYLRQAFVGKSLIDEPLEIKLVFHLANYRSEPDVSNLIEAPQDALTKAGIIKDDRLIQVVHARKIFGEQGTEIELYSIGD